MDPVTDGVLDVYAMLAGDMGRQGRCPVEGFFGSACVKGLLHERVTIGLGRLAGGWGHVEVLVGGLLRLSMDGALSCLEEGAVCFWVVLL